MILQKLRRINKKKKKINKAYCELTTTLHTLIGAFRAFHHKTNNGDFIELVNRFLTLQHILSHIYV